LTEHVHAFGRLYEDAESSLRESTPTAASTLAALDLDAGRIHA
jgi:hypothetical protein